MIILFVSLLYNINIIQLIQLLSDVGIRCFWGTCAKKSLNTPTCYLKPYIEDRHTLQWTQEDERTNNDLQNTTQKTKDLSKRICYTSANCHTTVVKHP